MIVSGAGVDLSVTVRGSGRPVLFVHDMAADAASCPPLQGVRAIAYDRRGYGGSSAPEPYGGTTVEEQSEDAAALLRGLDVERAVVVGDGFGALIALDLARRHPALVAGLVLRDPALLQFLMDGPEILSRARTELEASLRAHEPVSWEGRPVVTNAFYADFAGLSSWPVTRGELRAITVPCALVVSTDAPSYVRASADKLAGLLPGASMADDVESAVARVLVG